MTETSAVAQNPRAMKKLVITAAVLALICLGWIFGGWLMDTEPQITRSEDKVADLSSVPQSSDSNLSAKIGEPAGTPFNHAAGTALDPVAAKAGSAVVRAAPLR